MTVAQSRSCSESEVITKSKKYNVITLWLRKIVVLFLCNTQCCFHFRKTLFLTTTNKTKPKVSPVIESSGQECPAVVLTIRPKSRFYGEITKPAWTFDQNLENFFFCDSFSFVMILLVLPLTPMLVLFVTVIKCKKEQKKKKQKGFECNKPELNVYVLMSIFVSCLHFI